MSRKLDIETMQTTALFERVTRAHVKDCIRGDSQVTFIVAPGEMAKAIGKGGANVKKVTAMFKKPVVLIEYNEDPVVFVKSLVKVKNTDVSRQDNNIRIQCADTRSKGQVYGRERENTKFIQSLLDRCYSGITVVVE